MKKLTVRDYAREFELSESAVRKQLRSGKLAFTKQIINNRETTLIIVDDTSTGTVHTAPIEGQSYKGTSPKFDGTVPGTAHHLDSNEEVQEAEIISDSRSYNIVSMENNTFEKLIQSIKEIADDRSKSEKEAYSKLEQEYFELKAKCSKLEEENKALIIESAQNDTNYKISELKVKELEAQQKNLQDQFDQIKRNFEDIKNTSIIEKEKLELIIRDKEKTIENLMKEKALLEEQKLQETNKKSLWSALNNTAKL